MSEGWKNDKKWSDQFIPHIKSILGLYLIGEPPMEEDAERNTDLMVLRMESVRIGCRIRKTDYMARYGDEITIRSGRPSGAKTELTKIMEGWGDYFFYGFGTDADVVAWTLGDMKVFRLWFFRQLASGAKPYEKNNNSDNSSSFYAFIADLPEEFVVARKVQQ